MNDEQLAKLTPSSRAHVERGRSDEMRRVFSRVSGATGSLRDRLAFIEWELREADEVLSPNAPNNGRALDPFHASCCVERALSEVRCINRILGYKENT